ncbi:B12-binding domain-containing radical SAM protein [Candidatus Omnitrophota bacterium]
MKIVFLIPPPLDKAPAAERIFGCNYGIYQQDNIFILYSATILKNSGYEVTCIDFPILRKKRRDFEKFCETQNFDVIIFYSVFLSKKTDLIARDMLHAKNKKTKFIFMATEPTASPDDFVDENSIVIRGEPESRILDVIASLKRSEGLDDIPGISFSKNSKRVHNGGCAIIDNLDDLPFPDRNLFESKDYYNPKLSLQPFATMATSRGCSFRCYFCVPNSLVFAREIEFKRANNKLRPPVRLRSPKNVIAEFSMLAKAGYKSIAFIEDQFVWGDERTLEICNGIAGFGMEWSCLARSDMLLNYEVVKAMACAGCKFVAMGIESFNQEILDYIGKGCKKEVFYLAAENLKKAGIEVELNILIGSCPLETKETLKQTFGEVIALDPDYVLFSICTPFPYTSFNEKAKKEGWMIQLEYDAIDPIKESFISYPHLTKRELEKTIKNMYLKYYFRPSFIWKKMRKLKSTKDLVNKFKTALTILR